MEIKISTGKVARDYEVIDTIFAMDSHKEGVWKVADPNRAFEGVKKTLKDKCRELGGDAIQDCQFEYRVAVSEGMLGKKQIIEIFAYGTVVKSFNRR